MFEPPPSSQNLEFHTQSWAAGCLERSLSGIYKSCEDDSYQVIPKLCETITIWRTDFAILWLVWRVTCDNFTKNLQILLFVYNQTNMFLLLSGVTATTTFASALSYAFQKNTYTFQHMAYDHQSAKKLTALAIFILFNLGFTAHEFDLWSKLMENKEEWC